MRKTNLLFLFISALICIGSSQKMGTNLKNITESNRNKPRKKEDNPIKKDIKKYLRECGANVSDEESEEDQQDRDEDDNSEDNNKQIQSGMNNHGTYPNNYQRKNKGTYPTSYGSANKGGSDEDCEENEEESEEMRHNRKNENRGKKRMLYKRSEDVETFRASELESLEHYKNRNDNRRGGNKRKKNDDYDDSEDEDDDDGCDDRSKNRRGGNRNNNRNKNNRNRNNNRGGNNKRGGYSFGAGYGSGEDPYGNRYGGGYGGGYGVGEFGLYDGWGMYGGRLVRVNASEIESPSRKRRDAEYDEEREPPDVQLDDNRVPSETEVMRYLQHKIINSSVRMKTIREARRCFARLATTDTENGCQFSKSLAQCMKLGIEDKS